MRRYILCALAAASLLTACAGQAQFAQVQPTVCFRDGSCVPAGSTATPATPDGTRPPTFTQTVTPTSTSARETATPQPTGTPCIVYFRDGSSLPCGSTATPSP